MQNQKGQSIIEVLLASALLIILMPAIFAGLLSTREGRAQQQKRIDASYFLKETQEEVRIIRERGWSLFANNGVYHPEKSANTWILSSGPESANGLIRRVTISDVYRDETGKINDVGEVDSSTKLINILVTWTDPFYSSVETSFYLTRYLENIAYIETLENDFLLGETNGTTVINESGGEIVLGAGGEGNWCNPNESIVAELDLPKNGEALAISAVEGQITAGTGANSSGVSLANVSISNSNPPIATLVGTFDGYKTNDIFSELDYAYISTDTNSKEVSIININSTPYSEIGYVDLPGNTNADAITVSGQIGYVVQGSILWNFDLSSKSGSRPLLDNNGVTLAGNGTEVIVVGNYAYISLIGNVEMQIVDISNSSNLTIVGQANLNGNNGQDIAVNSTGTRAYLITSKYAGKSEFFVIDTTSKNGEQPVLGSLDTGDMNPKAVIIVPGNIAIAAGHGGEQYQIINISQDNNPNLCGSLNIGSDINDLEAILEADGNAFSYVLTTDSSSELKIIEGGPGGQFSTEGTFESNIFDANYDTVFNRFEANTYEPSLTAINYQFAVADDISGSCIGANYVYVGPDGTNSTFFSGTGAIPLDNDGIGYENPAQCFRYKVFFTSENSFTSPIFEDISINYSP
ncbi:MAG: hypothetical protein H6772_01075 [Pseudomonadales bacterium]|nr:hypothetical protein [Pseudomonadales bacterium]